MKTTSTIPNKYPGLNTQNAAFPLCNLRSNIPGIEDENILGKWFPCLPKSNPALPRSQWPPSSTLGSSLPSAAAPWKYLKEHS